MKIRIGIVLFILTAASVFAQDGAARRNESEYYYVTVPVERVYTYRLGYVVTYRKGPLGMAQAYLPIGWFSGAAAKGELVTLTGPGTWPYMAVYYKNGEFSHVKLAVRNRAHETWGLLPNREDLDSRFEGVESLQIEFR
ncbi:MAG: hypothetical protein LBQ35_01380 [Spirochaetaceae bacterium]|jgi:hypothetical protein|nr:hypothetical protein [Spirochaetaceae bacterium]